MTKILWELNKAPVEILMSEHLVDSTQKLRHRPRSETGSWDLRSGRDIFRQFYENVNLLVKHLRLQDIHERLAYLAKMIVSQKLLPARVDLRNARANRKKNALSNGKNMFLRVYLFHNDHITNYWKCWKFQKSEMFPIVAKKLLSKNILWRFSVDLRIPCCKSHQQIR